MQAEPIISDLAQLPARRAYSPEGGPGFLSLIKYDWTKEQKTS